MSSAEFLRDLCVAASDRVPFEALSTAAHDAAQMVALLAQLEITPSSDALLELGCGSAMLSACLQRLGFAVTPVDAAPHALWPHLAVQPQTIALQLADAATVTFLHDWALANAPWPRRTLLAVRCCELATALPALARAAGCERLVVVPCCDADVSSRCGDHGCVGAAWMLEAARHFDSLRCVSVDAQSVAWVLDHRGKCDLRI